MTTFQILLIFKKQNPSKGCISVLTFYTVMHHNLLWITTFLEGGLAVLLKTQYERGLSLMKKLLCLGGPGFRTSRMTEAERISGTEKKEINCSSYTEQ